MSIQHPSVASHGQQSFLPMPIHPCQVPLKFPLEFCLMKSCGFEPTQKFGFGVMWMLCNAKAARVKKTDNRTKKKTSSFDTQEEVHELMTNHFMNNHAYSEAKAKLEAVKTVCYMEFKDSEWTEPVAVPQTGLPVAPPQSRARSRSPLRRKSETHVPPVFIVGGLGVAPPARTLVGGVIWDGREDLSGI